MAFRAIILSAATLTLTTGCYVESMEDRAPGAQADAQPERVPSEGNCHRDLTKGCFDGNIISMKEFHVDGKTFFNADDLETRFNELITIADKDGLALTAGEDYQLALQRPLGNRNYLSEFTYDLTGNFARQDKVRNDGNFSINDLPEGNYDLRIQRPVRFDVLTHVTREPDASHPDVEPTVETKKKSYCATIYADTVLEIRRATRSAGNFSDFQLHVTDNECSAEGNGTALSLPN